MRKTLLIFSIAFLLSVFSQPRPNSFVARDFQGAQIVDSTFAYTDNIRYSPPTGRLYFTADKAIPNIYYGNSIGPSAKELLIYVGSPLNATASLPYLSYDVVNVQGVDYIIGSTYGFLKVSNFGLGIQVSTTNDKRVARVYPNNCFFYSTIIDPVASFVSNTYNVYFVGYCFGNTKNAERGLVVSRATVQLTGSLNIVWKEEDIYILDQKCYDVFTEELKPQLHLSKEGTYEFLYVAVPGKCNAIYKLQLQDGNSFIPRLNNSYLPNMDNTMKDIKITSTVFGVRRIYFSGKRYNFDLSYLYAVDSLTMKKVETFPLQANESTPILAIDVARDIVYVATSGFDKIYKITGGNLKEVGVAVLPQLLKIVSAMYYVNDTLYIVTYEPYAEIGRIPDRNFCPAYCSDFGYCNAGACACIPDYSRDPLRMSQFICVPTRYVKNIETVLSEQGTAAAFGVLFVLAIIAAVIGWFFMV